MSYWIDTEVKELELNIPKEDFPLKSDLIVGDKYPFIRYPEDEGDWDMALQSDIAIDGNYCWKLDEPLNIREKYNVWIETLIELILKYKGTLIADSVGEDGEVEYIRIRKGEKKSVKIIEE